MSLRKSNCIYAIIIFFLVIVHSGKTEASEEIILENDSIIRIYGYVYDSISDSPNLVPVKAQLVLESLPHGSEIGIISSIDSSGYFEYYVNTNHTYQVEVTAKYHMYHYEELDARKFKYADEVRMDFYLLPEFKKNQIVRLNKLIFEQSKADITPESFSELNKLVKIMKQYPKMEIQLEGHTDYRGSKKLNMQLSQDRVIAVRNYLINQGINGRRIKTKAYGGSKPLIKELSIEASEINRRVEFRVLKIE